MKNPLILVAINEGKNGRCALGLSNSQKCQVNKNGVGAF